MYVSSRHAHAIQNAIFLVAIQSSYETKFLRFSLSVAGLLQCNDLTSDIILDAPRQ